MEHDYDIGSTIKEKIISHVVSWFTGDAVDQGKKNRQKSSSGHKSPPTDDTNRTVTVLTTSSVNGSNVVSSQPKDNGQSCAMNFLKAWGHIQASDRDKTVHMSIIIRNCMEIEQKEAIFGHNKLIIQQLLSLLEISMVLVDFLPIHNHMHPDRHLRESKPHVTAHFRPTHSRTVTRGYIPANDLEGQQDKSKTR